MRFLAILVLVGGITNATRAADGPTPLNVWPAAVPGESGKIGPERAVPSKPGEKQVLRIHDVSLPTLTVYPAPADKHTGAAVLVCPGGGYNILAWDLEGVEVAEWLNSLGVTAAVLKYRVPRREGQPKHLAPLQDAQRAMSLLRSQAAERKLDPARIGILGFSAGGHLSTMAATNYGQRQYPKQDAVDDVSCRPDFVVLIYPAYLVEKGVLLPEVPVNAQTPPIFMAHAGDDPISPENSVGLYLALKQAKVPAELHVYGSGGHGFGLRASEHACSTWPKRCEEWLRARSLLVKPAP